MQIISGLLLGRIAAAWSGKQARRMDEDPATAIAAAVATSAGSPQLTDNITAPPGRPPVGMDAVVQTACAFGNSLTLPLLYLLTLFQSDAAASAATGFMALILLGWSPLFWSCGYGSIAQAVPESGDGDSLPLEALPVLPAPLVTLKPRDDSDGVRLQSAATAGSSVIDVLPADMTQLPAIVQDGAPPVLSADAVLSASDSSAEDPTALCRQDADGNALVPSPAGELAETADGAGKRMYMTPIADPSAKKEVKLPLLDLKKDARDRGKRGWHARLMEHVAADSREPSRWDALYASIARMANPPMVGALLGLLLGLTPLGAPPFLAVVAEPLHTGSACVSLTCLACTLMPCGRPKRWWRGAGGAVFAPGLPHVQELIRHLPWELSAALTVSHSVAEVAALLGSATLVLQAITLGASLVPKTSGAGFWQLLIPGSRWEWRQLISTSLVRLLLMPLIGLATVHAFTAWGLLPDSVGCKMALLVCSCMPSAQNLVLLVNLQERTKCLAPAMAQLLFRQYLLAVVPTTLWISVFLSYAGMQTL